MTNLTTLRLQNNQLTGEIPSWIGDLTNLHSLDLGYNQLTGEIPSSVYNLTNLYSLDLGYNQLSGEIPSVIGNLTNLQVLVLDDNQLTGEIPSEICNQGDSDPEVGNNQLCPPYPYCISQNDIDSQDTSECYGCTDPYATNYNPDTTVDDGSCIYPNYFETIWDEMTTTIMAIYIESAELDGAPLGNGDEICIFDGDACVGVARLDSPIYETYQIFVPADNSSTFEIDGYIAGNPIDFLYWDVGSQTVYSDIDITIISGSSTYQDFANTTVELSYDTIYGCMDIEACNYNPEANTNDGSCVYHDPYYCSCENEILDCTGECGGDAVMDDCDNCNGDCIEDDNGFVICGDSENNVFIADCAGTCGGDAVEDECGVCGGDGAIYECGCEDIADGECDCGVLQELGDMNCDYLFNVLDIVALVQEVLNDNEYYIYADVNEDGFVNVLDVVILVNWIIYGEPSLCDGLTEVELWGECYNIETTSILDLSNGGLTGEIPPEIGNLTNLTVLNLRWNGLTGLVPPEIGNLTNLTVLNLGYNYLTGEIPLELGNLTNLTELDLMYNQLSGEIPPEIGNLTNLQILFLYSNQLTGEIPPEVCDLLESNNLSISNILQGNNLINTCD